MRFARSVATKGTVLARLLRNVVQRNRIFHFCRAIPLDLRSRFGRREITCSLRTSDLHLAGIRAQRLWQQGRAPIDQGGQAPLIGAFGAVGRGVSGGRSRHQHILGVQVLSATARPRPAEMVDTGRSDAAVQDADLGGLQVSRPAQHPRQPRHPRREILAAIDCRVLRCAAGGNLPAPCRGYPAGRRLGLRHQRRCTAQAEE